MQLHIGHFHGEVRPDGSVIGFDYARQHWIDTRTDAQRDTAAQPGSAANPLRDVPAQS